MKKALFTNIEQVSFTVRNVDAVVELLKEVYGIGPWKCVNFGYLDDNDEFNSNTIKVEDCIYNGKYVGYYGLRICQCVIGKTELELIEPMDDKSLFSEYLEKNGQGGQHIAIDRTVGFAELMGIMAENGYPLSQLSKIDDIEDCAFVNHLRTLGTYLELHQRPENFQMPESFQKTEMVESERENVLGGIIGFSILVDNLEEALELLQDKYGIEGWKCKDIQISGNGTAKAAFCCGLNIDIILIQAECEDSLLSQIVKKNGPVIFDIIFEPSEYAKAVNAINEADKQQVMAYGYDGYEYTSYDHTSLFGGYITLKHKITNNM